MLTTVQAGPAVMSSAGSAAPRIAACVASPASATRHTDRTAPTIRVDCRTWPLTLRMMKETMAGKVSKASARDIGLRQTASSRKGVYALQIASQLQDKARRRP